MLEPQALLPLPLLECAPDLHHLTRESRGHPPGKDCTPEHPLGAPMVSSEGACAAYYNYGRFRHPAPIDV